MEPMIAYCGLTCTECPSYLATQANDEAAKERIAAEWRQAFNAPDIDAASVTCDGCKATSGRLCSYCSMCEIRACAMGRGLANCAYCADYACEKLTNFFPPDAPARATLDAIRRAL